MTLPCDWPRSMPKIRNAGGLMTLKQWHEELNIRLRNICGLGLDELPDLTATADLWGAGVSPADAVVQVLDDQGWDY